MADTRVVVILGARQVGKSTLSEQVARAEGSHRQILTLDDQVVRRAAQDDPAGFVATLRPPVASEADVLEHRNGSISAIEVKSAATVHTHDFRGLGLLRHRLGSAFKAGALLYTGSNTVLFGDRLAAVSISGLWTDQGG